jgi:hypothetical protein
MLERRELCSPFCFAARVVDRHQPTERLLNQRKAAANELKLVTARNPGPPYMPVVAIGDVSAGAHARGAIACASLYREKTGERQYRKAFGLQCRSGG